MGENWEKYFSGINRPLERKAHPEKKLGPAYNGVPLLKGLGQKTAAPAVKLHASAADASSRNLND